jgi:hypothetical protein
MKNEKMKNEELLMKIPLGIFSKLLNKKSPRGTFHIYSLFFILYSLFFILHSSFFILHFSFHKLSTDSVSEQYLVIIHLPKLLGHLLHMQSVAFPSQFLSKKSGQPLQLSPPVAILQSSYG